MRELDLKAVSVITDPRQLEEFIEQHEVFILRSAAKAAKHYVTKSDDEWSVALGAFSEAVEKYDFARGSFIAFADLMIRRKLIDFFRARGKYDSEVQVGWMEENAAVEKNDSSLRLEIEAISQVLTNYEFSFMDLAKCSPKAMKTKKACARTINYLLDRPILLNQMRNRTQLPIKIMEKNLGVPRKVIERHRKYIIAAVEILSGDYPYLAEYLRYVREEGLEDASSRIRD